MTKTLVDILPTLALLLCSMIFVNFKTFSQMGLSLTQTNNPNFFAMTLPLESGAHVTFFAVALWPSWWNLSHVDLDSKLGHCVFGVQMVGAALTSI